MLSHLRFHRRGPSNPSSPGADVSGPPPPWQLPSISSPADATPTSAAAVLASSMGGLSLESLSSATADPLSPPSADSPPTLPPIATVTSGDDDLDLWKDIGADLTAAATPLPCLVPVPIPPTAPISAEHAPASISAPPAAAKPAPNPCLIKPAETQPKSAAAAAAAVGTATAAATADTSELDGRGFIGGVALEKARRSAQLNCSWSQITKDEHSASGQRPALAPIQTSPVAPTTTKPSSSFVSPMDFFGPPASSGVTPGSRPAGKRPPGQAPAPVPSSSLAGSSSTDNQPSRSKRAFLKNPMSTLLLRRKTSQNAPDLSPLPIGANTDEMAYDPRIKGTRVHDFSAPRTRRVPVMTGDPAAHPPSRSPAVASGPIDAGPIPLEPAPAMLPSDPSSATVSPPPYDVSCSPCTKTTINATTATATTTTTTATSKKTPSTDTQPPPPGQPDDVHNRSASSPGHSRSHSADVSGRSGGPGPHALGPSCEVPVPAAQRTHKDVLSSIPRHMKSTSSRFSFDMIGSANQEKLLEERHRQRQLEKKATDPQDVQDAGRIDSRLDEFGSDDFDYDTMMDGDGFEEQIPGVNCDYDQDDDDDDPDNDQENFAGFEFQRSAPGSMLPTPRSAAAGPAPRDGPGNAIGLGTPRETPGLHPSPCAASPAVVPGGSLPLSPATTEQRLSGLGIQGLGPGIGLSSRPEPAIRQRLSFERDPPGPPAPQRKPRNIDELDFDGMNEFADELAGVTDHGPKFDEALFDLDDTDQYGRPLPGAFAAAQSQWKAKAGNRESGSNASRQSGQSGQSFASQPVHRPPSEELPASKAGPAQEINPVAVYQAALAAAACKAAASGKFDHDSSPSTPTDQTHHRRRDALAAALPETTNGGGGDDDDSDDDGHHDDDSHLYDDHDYARPLDDDYDDDDEFVREVNATALAYDQEGWYGHEFNFYSAPAPQNSHHTSSSLYGHAHANANALASAHANANANATVNVKAKSDQSMYEYSSGGYFGPPSAVHRSKSGRAVSREPNLTPITERSEYSNRNSIMSLGVASGFSGPTGGGLYSPAYSPGLAQLAMLDSADDRDMTLAALMRLRNRNWGGSQASLPGSLDGSPKSEQPSPLSAAGQGQRHHGRSGSSTYSPASRPEDDGAESGGQASPTLRIPMPAAALGPPVQMSLMAMPGSVSRPVDGDDAADVARAWAAAAVASPPASPAAMRPSYLAYTPERSATVGSTSLSSPQQHAAPQGKRRSSAPGPGHRHKGSAESVSYRREEDADGEVRWVMERTRTGERGRVEVVEREVVDGI